MLNVVMALPSLAFLSTGMLKREAEGGGSDDDARKQAKTRPPSKTAFFLWNDFLAWKELVLAELSSDSEASQVVHRIVGRGALPIHSTNSGEWFGVTAKMSYRKQPKPPEGLAMDAHRRWLFVDLLKSGKPMERKFKQYVLLDSCPGNFTLRVWNDLVLNPDGRSNMRAQRKEHLSISNLYPRNTCFKWMTGGDLLYAAGIVFSLLDVDYMTVCEGSGVRDAETSRRDPESPLFSRPDYFYYDKTILGPAQHVEHLMDAPNGYDSNDDEDIDDAEENGSFNFHYTRDYRDPESTMKCWLWEKPEEIRFFRNR